MIRSFLPTDLIVILFQRGSLSNVAKTRDNLTEEGARFLSLAALLIQRLNPRDGRCTWVCTEGLRFCGLASVRSRSLFSAWEVDHLLLHEQEVSCCSSLLERLVVKAGELGVERIFLRLPADSPLLVAAKDIGFAPYMTEYLHFRERREGEAASDGTSALFSPRRKQVGDDYRLFDLYQKCVPVSIRRVEGMTFKEWQATRERGVGTEWVFEKGGSLVGWLGVKAGRHAGQFEVMAAPEGELQQIIECGLMSLDVCRCLYCLAPEFDEGLLRLLEERGFSQVAKYSALAKELAIRERQPGLIPVSA